MYQMSNCACTKTAHILKVSELIVFLPVCCLLIISLENNSFYRSKCYYWTFDMFWAQNFSCSNKTVPCSLSQENSCTVNDWDTWFYSTYVAACELPGPRSCWLLCLECATRTCLLHQGWQCGRLETAHRGWMGSYHSIIASAIAHCSVASANACLCSRCRWRFSALSALQWHYPLFM